MFGWYRPGTGFTRVLETLLPALSADFRITWMGVGYHGPARQWSENVQLLPTNLHGGDMMGAWYARKHWQALKPDLVFALNDLWYLQHYSRELRQVKQDVSMIGYTPLDGRLHDINVLSDLTGFDTLLTYTRTAADDLQAALRELGLCTQVGVLGHGVDRQCFSPSPHDILTITADKPLDLRRRRGQLAQAWFKLDRPTFVVLNAARPDPRKNLQRTLEGFAMFAESADDDIKLCLHHAFEAPDQGCELREQIRALQLEPYLLWHPDKTQPVSDDALVQLYNACSVGLNTAHGEGFGLVSMEHAACAVPQILPDQAALGEIWGDCAQRLTASEIKTPHSPLMMVDVTAASVAAALHRLYSDPVYYHKQATAAWKRTTLPDLDWSGIAQKLQDTLLASV